MLEFAHESFDVVRCFVMGVGVSDEIGDGVFFFFKQKTAYEI